MHVCQRLKVSENLASKRLNFQKCHAKNGYQSHSVFVKLKACLVNNFSLKTMLGNHVLNTLLCFLIPSTLIWTYLPLTWMLYPS